MDDFEAEILDIEYEDEGVEEINLHIEDLLSMTATDFPKQVCVIIEESKGFGTYLFSRLSILNSVKGVEFWYECHIPNKYWEGKWGLATLLQAISEQVEFDPEFEIEQIELEDDWKTLVLKIQVPTGHAFKTIIVSYAGRLNRLITNAEIYLGGLSWRKEFETNERLFCDDVIHPLLLRMGFSDVRDRQGKLEFGKDFTFSETTKFGDQRHYGLQAKAGNISGEVNSKIDELLGQIDDAFRMPYYEIGAKTPRYISVFIIAISGRFTENAREKIAHKILPNLLGSVYFIDRDKIIELIQRYWSTSASMHSA